MSEEKETKEGHCPKCGSGDIDYGALDISCDGMIVFYPIHCNNCGHDDEEFYQLEFIGHKTD